jgi:CheY-like chemotaxis protein
VLPAGIRLEVDDLDRWVPTVIVDQSGLEHALLNLALNARDALRDRGGIITISVRRERRVDGLRGEAVTIEVRDNGPGIASDVLGRIFEPFFTTKGDAQGTGLGLAMVEAFAVENEGVVAVDSKVGQGTAFRLSFVAADDAPTEENLPVMTGTVLVVGASDAIGLAVTGALQRRGFTTVIVPDPTAALAEARRLGHVDAIVADAKTGMAAEEPMRAMRAAGVTAPLILSSATGAEGFSDVAVVLPKPVDPAALAETVRLTLRARIVASA